MDADEGRRQGRVGAEILVTNWCTWDLSVISTKLGRQVKRIPIGPYPGGIASRRRATPRTSP
jgi:hypothetical protein